AGRPPGLVLVVSRCQLVAPKTEPTGRGTRRESMSMNESDVPVDDVTSTNDRITRDAGPFAVSWGWTAKDGTLKPVVTHISCSALVTKLSGHVMVKNGYVQAMYSGICQGCHQTISTSLTFSTTT